VGAVKKGRGRYSRFQEFARVNSPKGIQQRQERRRATAKRDEEYTMPGSGNPHKVGR
jgi:hypothetical protein